MTENKTYYLRTYQLEELKARFAKIEKKAKKLNVDAPTFEIVEVKQVKEVEILGNVASETGRFIKLHGIQVHGKEVCLENYTLCAIIDHDIEGENVINLIDKNFDSDAFRTKEAYCQHCKTIRRRSQTFIVRHNETLEIAQIGKNCLADFIGKGYTPTRIAEICSFENDLIDFCEEAEENERRFRSPAERVDTMHVLQIASAIIRTYEYISASQANAQKVSTRSRIEKALGFIRDPRFTENLFTVTDEDKQTAENALKYAQSVSGTEFLDNLRAVATKETVKRKHFGFLSAIVPAYLREAGRIKEAEAKQAIGNVSEYFDAKIGERITVRNAKITFVRFIDNDFGGSYIVKFLTDDGKILTAFSSSNSGYLTHNDEATNDFRLIQIDDLISFKATVKKFEVFRDEKQTVLQRIARI